MKMNELRRVLHLTQEKVARLWNTTQPMIQNFEQGKHLPKLEEHFVLQAVFLHRLEWPEKFKPADKRLIIQAFVTLSERLPLKMVIEFFNRVIRNFETNKAKNIILHYAELAENEEKILTNS